MYHSSRSRCIGRIINFHSFRNVTCRASRPRIFRQVHPPLQKFWEVHLSRPHSKDSTSSLAGFQNLLIPKLRLRVWLRNCKAYLPTRRLFILILKGLISQDTVSFRSFKFTFFRLMKPIWSIYTLSRRRLSCNRLLIMTRSYWIYCNRPVYIRYSSMSEAIHALFNHFNVKLAGVIDLQLMELATRYYSRKYISGLAKCIDRDAPFTTDEMRTWKRQRKKGLSPSLQNVGAAMMCSTSALFRMILRILFARRSIPT